MIWTSTPIMIGIDLVICAMIAAMFVVTRRYGVSREGRTPRHGRVLAMSGIAIIGVFYLLDLLSMVLLPSFVGEERAMQAMTYLHQEANWYFTVVAVTLIGSGLIVLTRQRQAIEREIVRRADQVALVQREIVKSEIRFRSLIEQTPDAVYCLEFSPGIPVDLPVEEQTRRSYEAVLVECNQAFADELGVASPALAIGTRFGDMDSTCHTESHEALMRAFIQNGYRVGDYDLEYVSPVGSDRSFRINLTGVLEDDRLVRIWGAQTDTLEKKQVERALFERRRFQEFISAMSSRLIKSADHQLPDILNRCLTSCCVHFGYDRTSIVWFDEEHGGADAVFYWNEHGGPPTVEVSVDNYPWIAPQVIGGDLVTVGDPDELPPEAAVDARRLRELGLGTMVAVPLAIGDEVVGVITFGDLTTGRSWSEQDRSDLRVVADVFSNVVNRVISRQSLDRALDELRKSKERLEAEKVYLMEEISSSHGFDEIVGESRELRRCLRQVGQVAATTTAVLIQGETGTGKELIARAIHELSDRNDRPLVKVNCAALPANLIESELFGHEKGAFTGAVTAKRGRFDLADGGTMFLDEIGDFPLELQGKLLRALQEGEFQRLGGTETVKVDVRIIAATNRRLQEAVDAGEFRADLYYRINTFPIYLPRLTERIGDIPILAEHFVAKHAARLGKDVSGISASFMAELHAYDWPGNIRELEGVIQQALISSVGPILDAPESLIVEHAVGGSDAAPPRPIVDLVVAERQHIEKALSQAQWVIGGSTGAASILGLPPSTLRSKMKKLGIERPGHPT